nr:hypothetical protein [Desulfosporosinus sp. PR]
MQCKKCVSFCPMKALQAN